MISVDEAISRILATIQPLPLCRMPTADAEGYVLGEPITSDLDSPPYDKAMVDGFAVVSDEIRHGPAVLTILEEVTAGEVPQHEVEPGGATRIMTGAPLPQGADGVVMVERTELLPGEASRPERVRILQSPVKQGSNVLRRATVLARGDVVLHRGALIRPVEVGLLMEVGRTEVSVMPRPTVAILSTGNELVPPDEFPGPGQIRNSNGPMLQAAVRRRRAKARSLGIAPDERPALRAAIERGLREADVLLISGGVSAGVLDLVPGVLDELGVSEVFHKVRIKPGKPLWFGTELTAESNKLVFGLPGNPVSGLVCFELFVRPAIDRLAGRPDHASRPVRARLSSAHHQHGDRPTYYPAILKQGDEEPSVEPVAWRGSADLRSVTLANSLACFPAGDRDFSAGDRIDVLPLI